MFYDDIKKYLESKGFLVITTKEEFNVEKYKQKKNPYHTKLVFKDKNKYLYYTSINHIKEGFIPLKFGKSNKFTINNIKNWLKINLKPFNLISDTYSNATIKLKWKCLKEDCGEIFEMRWADIQSGVGCPFCAGKRVGLSNCLATKNPELASEWHPTLNGNLTPYDVTCGTLKKVYWKCKKCGYEWDTNISNRHRGRGCPRCKESKGEKIIDKWLENNNKYFEREYTSLPDLLSDLGNPLRCDFAVFKNKNKEELELLIEYDGEGHFSPKPFGKDSYKITKYHDKLKNEYCKNNNIKLLRIKYDQFEKIEEILSSVLK